MGRSSVQGAPLPLSTLRQPRIFAAFLFLLSNPSPSSAETQGLTLHQSTFQQRQRRHYLGDELG